MAGMSQVLPCLFVGSQLDATDKEQMKKNSITHVVTCYEDAHPFDNRYKFLCINAQDENSEDISKHFSHVNDFIHEARLKGSVLVHCVIGRSRSVTLVMAYLITVTSLSFEDALKVVQYVRPMAFPNNGFQQQLKHFNFKKEIERFRKKFGNKFDRFNDLAECQRIFSPGTAPKAINAPLWLNK